MAITLDATTYGSADNLQTVTISHTIASNSNKLICQASVWGSGRIVTGVTWNGVAMTVAKQIDDAGDSNNASIWYLDSPTTGTHDMVVTATSSTAWLRAAATSLIGASTGGADSTAGLAYTTQLNGITTSITTVAASCWVFDAILDQNNAMTEVSPQVNNFNSVTDNTSLGSYKTDVAAGSNSMGWTWLGLESGAHALAAFAPAGTAKNLSILGVGT